MPRKRKAVNHAFTCVPSLLLNREKCPAHAAPCSLSFPPAAGKPESITTPDAAANGFAHVCPQSLPGGRAVLFTVWGKGVLGSAVLSLDTRKWKLVLPGGVGTVFAPSVGSSG